MWVRLQPRFVLVAHNLCPVTLTYGSYATSFNHDLQERKGRARAEVKAAESQQRRARALGRTKHVGDIVSHVSVTNGCTSQSTFIRGLNKYFLDSNSYKALFEVMVMQSRQLLKMFWQVSLRNTKRSSISSLLSSTPRPCDMANTPIPRVLIEMGFQKMLLCKASCTCPTDDPTAHWI